jgi:aerobic-type carbon monoxide dehydrogenase small subunit (CoxS/CutS family)
MTKVARGEKTKVQITINGKEIEEYVETRKLLSDFLREDCGLTGTHIGCEHGVCGSCTVLYNGSAVRTCLMFAVQANGGDIQTVEGLANDSNLHPLREAFSECHALQCGFCTPGILMSSLEMVNADTAPSKQEINEMLSGHLCRCTGYKGIVEAIEKVVLQNNKDCKERDNSGVRGTF